ncbi:uncharacterized protein LOC107605450 [Arachis ipaensis]|uniref:uncharacterized protein LOC107605450 n=1 Tax=Arachis ipaensis TaxID=130454 RepID=UPI0007AF3D92|nr:uncharacterized protein LOC107605450 [Arachis ipaensis]XP_025659925.1 uncharacterized protein LOC112755839 [Arachis hypogaea]
MATSASCSSTESALMTKTLQSSRRRFRAPIGLRVSMPRNPKLFNRIRASMVDSSSDFVSRIEKTWLISQQPRPIVCSSCNSKGHTECKWCGGTGFFIIGDKMLCEVPSKNTSCIICNGKGSMCCSDCQGTGFRAKWLEEPPTSK